MPALYTALAILGWLVAGLILFAIAWAVLNFDSFVDFVAQLFEEEAREFADSDSRTAALANQIIDGSR
jgi:Mn2+/Fe2+ NRAMP family transporter